MHNINQNTLFKFTLTIEEGPHIIYPSYYIGFSILNALSCNTPSEALLQCISLTFP